MNIDEETLYVLSPVKPNNCLRQVLYWHPIRNVRLWVAAGVGAGAGVAYMMGGDEKEIFHTIANMIGSISGLICDGGKGCAFKVALSSVRLFNQH